MTASPEILGQDAAWASLTSTWKSGRLAHAFLFHGPRGVGKASLARRFAGALLCARSRKLSACGTCDACRAFAAGEHPDFDEIAPPSGARNISIDAMRDMSRRAGLSPSMNGRRVFLIDDAHAMTEEAANSLLKTLEEPPDPVVMLLVTFKPQALLPTVLSRTRQLTFRSLPAPVCVDVLRKDHGLERDEATDLTALSQGSPGRALEMRSNAAYLRRDEIVSEILRAQKRTVFDSAAKLLEIGKEAGPEGAGLEPLRMGLREVLLMVATFLRDVEVSRRTGGAADLLHRRGGPSVARALAVGDGRWAAEALDALTQARDAIEGNVKPVLVLEWWLSRVVRALDHCRTYS